MWRGSRCVRTLGDVARRGGQGSGRAVHLLPFSETEKFHCDFEVGMTFFAGFGAR